MRQLRLVGLNEDGTRLVLRDEAAKTDYLLPNDERLAAALRGDRARLGQLEITLESQLRPREMQARVRAGESPDKVAKAAGLPMDKVMRLVAPVVAEREWVVEQARKASIRRPGTEGPGAVLEPTVSERLAASGVQPDTARWDSRRRDDGAWVVEVSYRLDGREHVAEWTYDATAKATTPVDDEARALSGIRPPVLPPLLFADDPDDEQRPPSGQPRLTSLRGGQSGTDQPPTGQSAIDQEREHDPHAEPDGPAAVGDVGSAGDDGDPADESAAEPGGARGRAAKRASVPSWDEIMFGRRRTRD